MYERKQGLKEASATFRQVGNCSKQTNFSATMLIIMQDAHLSPNIQIPSDSYPKTYMIESPSVLEIQVGTTFLYIIEEWLSDIF